MSLPSAVAVAAARVDAGSFTIDGEAVEMEMLSKLFLNLLVGERANPPRTVTLAEKAAQTLDRLRPYRRPKVAAITVGQYPDRPFNFFEQYSPHEHQLLVAQLRACGTACGCLLYAC